MVGLEGGGRRRYMYYHIQRPHAHAHTHIHLTLTHALTHTHTHTHTHTTLTHETHTCFSYLVDQPAVLEHPLARHVGQAKGFPQRHVRLRLLQRELAREEGDEAVAEGPLLHGQVEDALREKACVRVCV